MDENEYLKLPGYCKYFNELRIDNIFKDKKIRFSQPWVMNDPFEFNPIIIFNEKNEYNAYELDGIIMPSMNDWFRIQLIESQVNDYGILSLTKNPVSFTMWNHYGNGHKGFLIELKNDFNKHNNFKSKADEIYPIEKVEYVKEFVINISNISDGNGKFLIKDFNKQFFYNKSERWKYEQEYRLVRKLEDLDKEYRTYKSYRDVKGLYCEDLPFEVINTVTFGAHMSINNKLKIIEYLKDTEIQFLQAIVYKDELDSENNIGKVELLPLDNEESFKTIIDLQPQLLSCEKKIIKNKKIVRINRVEDLPYFNEQYKNSIFQMYNNMKNRLEKEQKEI